jgi:hypothetical protein
MIAGAVVVAVGLVGAAGVVAPAGVAQAAASPPPLAPATLPTAAAHDTTPHRPASCPPETSADTADGPTAGQPSTPTGTVPWPPVPAGTNPERAAASDHTPATSPPVRPSNWDDDGGSWKLTSARSTSPVLATNPQELCGVEGSSVDRAWQVSTGSPHTLLAITDSGIEWCDPDIVDKLYLNEAALPLPEDAAGLTKPELEARGQRFTDSDPYDLDDTGVVNVAQYAADPRVAAVAKAYGGLFCSDAANRDGYTYTGISPMDLIRAFGTPTLPDGRPNPYYYGHQGPAGFTEAISGWNFVNNDNDPYDDVHYDHGTGEAQDSGGAANTLGHELGTCPNCMILPIRVGDSFITSADQFAEGVLFAVDSGATVVQEALGTVDVTEAARQAIDYADAHGVPVVASAADEHAEHHNLPAVVSHTLVVNSITQSTSESVGGTSVPLQAPHNYLMLNGCTNYGANIAVSTESASCSSEATGKTSGIVGLAESAAAAQVAAGRLAPYPGLRSGTGAPVALSVNEIKQLLTMTASSVDFGKAAPPVGPPDNFLVISPVPTTRFPTHPGFTPYFGYGRTDAARMLQWIAKGWIPPQAEITNLPWFESLAPTASVPVDGVVGSPRPCPGAASTTSPCPYRYQVQVGVGDGPTPGSWRTVASGTGQGVRSGRLATVDLAQVAALFPAAVRDAGFGGGPVGADGQPDLNRFTFTVRVVVEDDGPVPLVGMATRAEFLHRDTTEVLGHPLRFGGSIDTSPTLAPIGPGGTDVLLVATADGVLHAIEPDGRELPGWPVRTELDAGVHLDEAAYRTGGVDPPRAPFIDISGGVAVGDLADAAAPCLHGPHPSGSCLDVVATTYDGQVYAWNARGQVLPGFPVSIDPAYSTPAVANPDNRVLPGIASAAALAPLEGTIRTGSRRTEPLDIVVAAMDRHVYAWQPDGAPVPGWPVLVVDPSQVASVDPVDDQVTFKDPSDVAQGTKLMDTPAIGLLAGGSGPPDVVVGSNEEYLGSPDTSVANPITTALGAVLGASGLVPTANTEVYAISPHGTDQPAPAGATPLPPGDPDNGAILPGWPASVADFDAGLLPDVGDGMTNSPALAPATSTGPSGLPTPLAGATTTLGSLLGAPTGSHTATTGSASGSPPLMVGAMSTVGPAYLFDAHGASLLGDGVDGKPATLSVQPTGPLSNATDGGPSIPALGGPIFAPLGPAAPGTSLVAPAASVSEVLNEAFPGDHPVHQNEVDAWSTTTAHFDAGFPQTMDDLQFFDQPLVADVGGAGAGPYVVEASASYDVRAFDALGQEAPGFPKFTGGWVVNSPVVGRFGTLADQVLATGTREGWLFVWSLPTPACASSGPWATAHHDLWNTNDLATTGAPSAPCSAAADLRHR